MILIVIERECEMDFLKLIVDEDIKNAGKFSSRTVNILSSVSKTGVSTKVSIPKTWLESIGAKPNEQIFICKMIDHIRLCKSLSDISFEDKKSDMLKIITKEMNTKGYCCFYLHKDKNFKHHDYYQLRAIAETYFHFEKGLIPEEHKEVDELINCILDELKSKYSFVENTESSKQFNINVYYNKNIFPVDTQKNSFEIFNDLQKRIVAAYQDFKTKS